ncbi:hypothetical protein ACF061_24775 [Streptomyces sp. NPDC015220]|uniref:hypothetical protein n=1 Tax=Streptomyces sp. NPDC015220 TaxID=3364947 RepID=UPI0036FE6761
MSTHLAGVAMGVALLAGGITAPAQAASEAVATKAAPASSTAPGHGPAVAAEGWTTALRAGDPVRDGYSASNSVLWRTSGAGQSLHYYSTKVNSAGNRWYQIDSPKWGWIYCGNVSAPC